MEIMGGVASPPSDENMVTKSKHIMAIETAISADIQLGIGTCMIAELSRTRARMGKDRPRRG